MLTLTHTLPFNTKPLESKTFNRSTCTVVLCAAKGPRPRYPRVWKTRTKIGTTSKSTKLVECVKGLSNVKEEVYGALDSFIAWDLEFPLIVVKKALTTLEYEKEWKRIIQVTKWMLSKGQGRTMGSYLTLLNALVEDDRLEEAEEIWTKVFTENMESTPRYFFEKMVTIYYKRGMHEKLFEIFADMDELGIYPTVPVVNMVGNVFQKLGMTDKYQKLVKKFPPPKWEFRYIKGKRIKVRAKRLDDGFKGANQVALAEKATTESSSDDESVNDAEVTTMISSELHREAGNDEIMNKNTTSRLYEEASEDAGNSENEASENKVTTENSHELIE